MAYSAPADFGGKKGLQGSLDPEQEGTLWQIRQDAKEMMNEIEKTAKEVSGDPEASPRYLHCRQVVSLINDLEKLVQGRYTFNIADKGTIRG